MKKVIIIVILVLALMEGVAWLVYTSLSSKDADEPGKLSEQTQTLSPPLNITNKAEEKPVSSTPPVSDSGSFPPPSTEVVNGVTERTIHIGVRQWAWDPDTITAKEGELVRLIVHNADVKHGLAISELGVNEAIPEDGAVITFKATKKGTFEFLCSVYCGVGHALMQGKIIIE